MHVREHRGPTREPIIEMHFSVGDDRALYLTADFFFRRNNNPPRSISLWPWFGKDHREFESTDLPHDQFGFTLFYIHFVWKLTLLNYFPLKDLN